MNDEGKSLLFLILSLGCAWLILDMVYGKKYIDKLVDSIFGGTSNAYKSNGSYDDADYITQKYEGTDENMDEQAQKYYNELYKMNKSLASAYRQTVNTGLVDPKEEYERLKKFWEDKKK